MLLGAVECSENIFRKSLNTKNRMKIDLLLILYREKREVKRKCILIIYIYINMDNN